MNDPYPRQMQLTTETIADALLAEQAAATTTYLAALHAFATVFDTIDWPLGCPVAGYDTQAIHGTIADLMTVTWEFDDAAIDAARERVMA